MDKRRKCLKRPSATCRRPLQAQSALSNVFLFKCFPMFSLCRKANEIARSGHVAGSPRFGGLLWM
eukprot:9442833-Alexandrium_andersonii.AAC.1